MSTRFFSAPLYVLLALTAFVTTSYATTSDAAAGEADFAQNLIPFTHIRCVATINYNVSVWYQPSLCY